MEFRVLGLMEVVDRGRVLPIGGPKRRAVLALLLLNANRGVSVDSLIDGVWGDHPPPRAVGSLQNHVVALRRLLGTRLQTRTHGYLLEVGPDELDAARFSRLVREARGLPAPDALAKLQEALALWRGAPLADLAGEPVASGAAFLEEERLAALEDRIDADMALGRHAQLVPELELLIAEQPYRERLRRQLMLALYRSERQVEALAAYTDARRTLIDEAGLEPGRELRELQRAILRHDEALDAPPRPPPAKPPIVPGPRHDVLRPIAVLSAELVSPDAPADPERRRDLGLERRRRAEEVLTTYGGVVDRADSDRLRAVFGIPEAHDDDALRAASAALALVERQIAVKAGLSTGRVIAGEGPVTGPALAEAEDARVTAMRSEVASTEAFWHLVRHAATVHPRGELYVLERVDEDAGPRAAQGVETPLVGREREIETLLAAFRRVVEEGRPRLVAIVGEAGIGKTRIVNELGARVAKRATVLVGRCRAYGTGVAYAPLGEALAPLGAATLPRVPAEVASVVRRLLEDGARDRPVVLVIDDVHAASAELREALDRVADLGRGSILIVETARQDLLELSEETSRRTALRWLVQLEPLPDTAARRLVGLSAAHSLDSAALDRVVANAGGNPLFLEELSAAALDGYGPGKGIPETLQSVLAARLDRLPVDARELAEVAAVCGTSFDEGVVQAVVGGDLGGALAALARLRLVCPGDARDEAWRFRHAIIRDAVYASIPPQRRARFHEAVADAYLHGKASALAVVDERAGHHLEQMVLTAGEMGQPAAATRRAAASAAEHLAAAGTAAFERDEMSVCVPLLERALALLGKRSPSRITVALRLAEALQETGKAARAQKVLDTAQTDAARWDDRLQARVFLTRAFIALATDWQEAPERVWVEARAALPALEQSSDHEGLARAYLLLAAAADRTLLSPPGGVTMAELDQLAEKALTHARLSASPALQAAADVWAALWLRRGALPASEAERRALQLLADAPTEFARAGALGSLAILHAMKGRFDTARTIDADAQKILADLGLRRLQAAHLITTGEIELIAGDFRAAERILRTCHSETAALGDVHSCANAAWRLALALLGRGRVKRVPPLLTELTRTTPRGYWVEIWRILIAARVAAERRDLDASRHGLAELRPLLDRIQPSAMLADLFLEMAHVEQLCGDESADQSISEALRIAERLEYTVTAERARAASL